MDRTNLIPGDSAEIKPEWAWVRELVEEAHLPKLGLPVRWAETEKKHAKIAYDPDTKTTVDLSSGIKKTNNISAVGFITATKDINSMPGATAPASVRWARFQEPELQGATITDQDGNLLVPCMAHGDFVKVESLDADHAQAKSEIIRRQKELVEKLNKEPDFAEFMMQQPGMSKFFVQVQDAQTQKSTYFGTLLFYELYFNDIDNIWLICGACNSKKSNQDTLKWLDEQWGYGQDFLDYVRERQVTQKAILQKAQDGTGLAQLAINWFWLKHANYISTAKKLYEDVVIPVQILNRTIDRVRGQGQHVRAERLEATTRAKLAIMQSVMDSKIGMPKAVGESQHSSSDSEARMSPMRDSEGKDITVDSSTFMEAVGETATELQAKLPDMLRNKISEKVKKRKERP